MHTQINILIIEPNVLIRQTVYEYFNKSKQFNIVGKAHDAKIALSKAYEMVPDIIIVDFSNDFQNEMESLKQLLSDSFVPIIFFSNREKVQVSQIASELVSINWSLIKKPSANLINETILLMPKLEQQIRHLHLEATMRFDKFYRPSDIHPRKLNTTEIHHPKITSVDVASANQRRKNLIALGASTGGTTALLKILSSLPVSIPGIVAVIHMPHQFTGAFAKRLNSLCKINVVEATNNQQIISGQAIIAPGNRQLYVRQIKNKYYTEFGGTDLVNGHCPSVDVLFKSVADEVGKNSVGVILTGMGKDGSEGVAAIHKMGGFTIAQDRLSSAVFGMPKAAVDSGCVREVISLSKIPARLIGLCGG